MARFGVRSRRSRAERRQRPRGHRRGCKTRRPPWRRFAAHPPSGHKLAGSGWLRSPAPARSARAQGQRLDPGQHRAAPSTGSPHRPTPAESLARREGRAGWAKPAGSAPAGFGADRQAHLPAATPAPRSQEIRTACPDPGQPVPAAALAIHPSRPAVLSQPVLRHQGQDPRPRTPPPGHREPRATARPVPSRGAWR